MAVVGLVKLEILVQLVDERNKQFLHLGSRCLLDLHTSDSLHQRRLRSYVILQPLLPEIFFNFCNHSPPSCLHPVISLIGVLYSCIYAWDEYKNISLAVSKLSSSDFNRATSRCFTTFSLRLMTEKMQLTGKGFFGISNKTLREVK